MTDIDKLQRKINEINDKSGFNESGFINDLQTLPEAMETKDIDKAAREWIKTPDNMPEYDGRYLCHIVRNNECGTVSKYQNMVECFMNEWILPDERERITHFMIVPDPDCTVRLMESCQPEIGELIEALEEMRWVPVSEGAPESNSRILVKFALANGVERTAVAAYVGCGIKCLDGFTIPGSTSRNVTHWRPIDTPKATQLLEKYGKVEPFKPTKPKE